MLTLPPTQVQESDTQGTIERSLDDSCAMELNEKHSNQAEFERLKEEDRELAGTCLAAQTAIAATLALPNPFTQFGIAVAGSVVTTWLLKRARKLRDIWETGEPLDEAFQDRDVQIYCDLEVPDLGRLDLFIKFPNAPQKAIFTIALRRRDKAKIYYREDKEAFYVRTANKSWKPWKPDHIERLGLQEYWLRKNQQELFGTSVRDRNRPAIKLLVLTGDTKIGQHPEHLYTQVGDQRVLLIRRRASVYVLHQTQLIPFIQGWFAPKEG